MNRYAGGVGVRFRPTQEDIGLKAGDGWGDLSGYKGEGRGEGNHEPFDYVSDLIDGLRERYQDREGQ